jgi:hypothetical protein
VIPWAINAEKVQIMNSNAKKKSDFIAFLHLKDLGGNFRLFQLQYAIKFYIFFSRS